MFREFGPGRKHLRPNAIRANVSRIGLGTKAFAARQVRADTLDGTFFRDVPSALLIWDTATAEKNIDVPNNLLIQDRGNAQDLPMSRTICAIGTVRLHRCEGCPEPFVHLWL